MPDWERRTILALDAMGVLYAAADDVAELLVPFVRGKGSSLSAREIEREYLAASLGEIDATAFWKRVGVDPGLEDEYLAGHRLTPGVADLLSVAGSAFGGVCCLSNDVSRWSIKLRRTFGLEAAIAPWIISADVAVRKPCRAIYELMLKQLNVPADHVLFVDDRVKNLDAAKSLGIRTALFDPGSVAAESSHPRVSRLSELLQLAGVSN